MTEVTNDPLYELVKSIHQRVDRLDAALSGVKQEVSSVRLSMMGIQSYTHNLLGMMARHEERFDRIERGFDLREFAEPQRPIQP